jgi:hypothetical protein
MSTAAGIASTPQSWSWQRHEGRPPSGAAAGKAAASNATSSIANTGTISASNLNAFFQSFSADLQAMLAQAEGAAGSTAASQATNTQTSVDNGAQAAVHQPLAGAHHHHHRPEGTDGGGPVQNAATVMQALRAYGSNAPPPAGNAQMA